MLGANNFPGGLQAFYFSAESINHSSQCQGQNLSLNIASCQTLLQGVPSEQQGPADLYLYAVRIQS